MIAELQNSPAYAHLDVRLCYFKMVEWCKRNHKVPSEKRFINWLNKEDKPMTATPSPPKPVGNAYVGKHQPKANGAEKPTDAEMLEFVDAMIEADDIAGIGEQYDLIVKRGVAEAEWEVRVVAWYELRSNCAG